jgi:hypothetical protein
MTFSFHPEAEREFIEAINYYEEREDGLGYAFSVEIYSAIQNILDYPKAWPIFEDDIRRCLAFRFPYGVLYSIEENGHILLVAIMNLNRTPDYWKDRY